MTGVLLLNLFACGTSPGARRAAPLVVSADGNQIHVERHGSSGPVILFVHGLGGSTEEWADQVVDLAAGHRVVTMDLVGFGVSGRNRADWTMAAFGHDVAAVLTQLDLRGVTLVGHSMGAAAVLEAALLVPDRIATVVPVDVWHDVDRSYTGSEIDRFLEQLGTLFRAPSPEALRPAFKQPIDSMRLERVVRGYRAASPTAWRASALAYFRWVNERLRIGLSENHVPIVCINSDRYESHPGRARTYAPAFDVRIVPNVGHQVMIDDPAAFNRELRSVVMRGEDAPRWRRSGVGGAAQRYRPSRAPTSRMGPAAALRRDVEERLRNATRPDRLGPGDRPAAPGHGATHLEEELVVWNRSIAAAPQPGDGARLDRSRPYSGAN